MSHLSSAPLIRAGAKLNRLIQTICVLLTAAMILIVWIGIASRYVIDMGITWNEELSRYVMIWAALLAVSVGCFQREHIGFELFLGKFPQPLQRGLRIFLDLVAIAFFLFLAVYGVGMTLDGRYQYATIFGMTMLVPFASVPVSSALAAFQCIVALCRDTGRVSSDPMVETLG